MTTAFPLHWPDGWPRTEPRRRKSPGAKFGYRLTIAKARDRLLNELRLMGARNVVISSNLKLRNDGLPYSQQTRIEDEGVAVYFTREDRQMVMAHDRWWSPEANINALALAIAGMRQMERHGGATMLERAFAGFEALPAPTEEPYWMDVLDVNYSGVTLDEAKQNYRRMAMEVHPDNGGTTEEMTRLNTAMETAQRELSA